MNIGPGITEVESSGTGSIARLACAGAVLLGISVSAAAQTPPRTDSTGTVVGIVTTKEAGQPLPYSVVSTTAPAREQFSNERGVFTLVGMSAGPLRVRIRHLGYTPADLSVIVRAGRADTVRIELSHIAIQLAAMQVRGYSDCKTPGAPKPGADSVFATVFDQLRQNADQFRLLTREYPFAYAVERTFSTSYPNGDVKMGAVDTAAFASTDAWTYRPGTVVQREGVLHALGFGTLMMHIPTLANFADPAFIENHCFYNGGLEVLDGMELLRVDFQAASRLSDPDVNGSMYLDPHNFQIRRSIVRLSRIPRGITGLAETEAQTYFGEVVASVPVIVGVMSVNRFIATHRAADPIAANEQQQTVALQFLKGKPGEQPAKPNRPAPRTRHVSNVRQITQHGL